MSGDASGGTIGADRDDVTSRLGAELADLLRRAREQGVDLTVALKGAEAGKANGSATTEAEPTAPFQPGAEGAAGAEDELEDAPAVLGEETQPMPDSGPGSKSKSKSGAGAAGAAGEDDPAEARLGGRYRIVRPYAEGGLGVVHVAADEELDREVAIKRIRPGRSALARGVRDRFEREGRITGGLEHPGVAPVYSLGMDAEGNPYYAMRLIRGLTMRQALKRLHTDPGAKADDAADADAVPPEAWNLEFRGLLRRFLSVCETVQYAHQRGVLHRDLKPSNVILGEHGETIVLDWGLAKVALGVSGSGTGLTGTDIDAARHPSWGSSLELTLPGSVVGTVSYMSPEQAVGRTSVASDVFNLGATLYSILAGRAPYRDREDTADLLRAVREADFPAPASIARRPVPRALEAICLKAMARAPEARYASARALGADLERWLADEPVTAHRDGPITRARRWLRRHRPLAATLATAAVGGVLALVALNLLTESLRRAAVAAEAEARIAERDATDQRDRADALYRRARGLVSRIALPVADRLAGLPMIEELRQQVAGEMAESYRAFRSDPSAQGDAALTSEAARAFRMAANIRRLYDEDEAAGALYDEALAGFEEAAKSDPERRADVALVRIDRSSWNIRHGRVAAAEAELDAARRALGDSTDRPFILGLIHLDRASLRLSAGRPTEARAEAEQALARFQAAGSVRLAPLLIGMTRVMIGSALRDEGRADEAVAALKSVADELRDQARRKPFDADLAFARANAAFELSKALDHASPGDPAAMTALSEAFQAAAQRYNQNPTLPHLRRFLIDVLAARAEKNAEARKIDAARKDAAQALALANPKPKPNAAAPAPAATIYADLNPAGHALAASARVARAAGEGADAVRTPLEQARARHAAALAVDPSSQADRDAVAAIEAELKSLP